MPATAPCDAAATVIVRPLLLKLAISGAVPAIASSAEPLLSEKAACVMVLLSKERAWLPGGTSGSRVNTMRNLPGSVEIVGLTGALKFSTNLGGLAASSCAWTSVATSPMNSRRAFS